MKRVLSSSASAFTAIGIFQTPITFEPKTSSGSLTLSSTKLLIFDVIQFHQPNTSSLRLSTTLVILFSLPSLAPGMVSQLVVTLVFLMTQREQCHDSIPINNRPSQLFRKRFEGNVRRTPHLIEMQDPIAQLLMSGPSLYKVK